MLLEIFPDFFCMFTQAIKLNLKHIYMLIMSSYIPNLKKNPSANAITQELEMTCCYLIRIVTLILKLFGNTSDTNLSMFDLKFLNK